MGAESAKVQGFIDSYDRLETLSEAQVLCLAERELFDIERVRQVAERAPTSTMAEFGAGLFDAFGRFLDACVAGDAPAMSAEVANYGANLRHLMAEGDAWIEELSG